MLAFTKTLQALANGYFGFRFEYQEVESLLEKQAKARIIFTFNGHHKHLALAKSQDFYYIMLGSQSRKELQLTEGNTYSFSLEPDTTEIQFHIPEEWSSVLSFDEMAAQAFAQLSDGRKRGLLHLIAKYKSEQKRVEASLRFASALKRGLKDLKDIAGYKESS